jgi:hypothetical protein
MLYLLLVIVLGTYVQDSTSFGHLRACSRLSMMDRTKSDGTPSSSIDYDQKRKSIFIFGLGYVGCAVANALLEDGWKVAGTCTSVPKLQTLRGRNISAFLFDEESGLVPPDALTQLSQATHILSTVPPSDKPLSPDGKSGLGSDCLDPVLRLQGAQIKAAAVDGNLQWLGYLSSTGVYGERGGAWVREADPPAPDTPKTRRRLAAELAWRGLHTQAGLPVHVFRLAGIYGPGRSAADTLVRAGGDMARCGADDSCFVSRIHVQDIVRVLPSPRLAGLFVFLSHFLTFWSFWPTHHQLALCLPSSFPHVHFLHFLHFLLLISSFSCHCTNLIVTLSTPTAAPWTPFS